MLSTQSSNQSRTLPLPLLRLLRVHLLKKNISLPRSFLVSSPLHLYILFSCATFSPHMLALMCGQQHRGGLTSITVSNSHAQIRVGLECGRDTWTHGRTDRIRGEEKLQPPAAPPSAAASFASHSHVHSGTFFSLDPIHRSASVKVDELLARLLHQKRVLLKDTRTLDLEICAEFLQSLQNDKKLEKVAGSASSFFSFILGGFLTPPVFAHGCALFFVFLFGVLLLSRMHSLRMCMCTCTLYFRAFSTAHISRAVYLQEVIEGQIRTIDADLHRMRAMVSGLVRAKTIRTIPLATQLTALLLHTHTHQITTQSEIGGGQAAANAGIVEEAAAAAGGAGVTADSTAVAMHAAMGHAAVLPSPSSKRRRVDGANPCPPCPHRIWANRRTASAGRPSHHCSLSSTQK